MLMQSFSTQQLNSCYLQEDSMDRYFTELKMVFFSFSYSFFTWLSLCFCLFIPFCYLSFVLISQVFVTFYIWFCWQLVLLSSIFYFLSFLVSSLCKCVIYPNRKKIYRQNLSTQYLVVRGFKNSKEEGGII